MSPCLNLIRHTKSKLDKIKSKLREPFESTCFLASYSVNQSFNMYKSFLFLQIKSNMSNLIMNLYRFFRQMWVIRFMHGATELMLEKNCYSVIPFRPILFHYPVVRTTKGTSQNRATDSSHFSLSSALLKLSPMVFF